MAQEHPQYFGCAYLVCSKFLKYGSKHLGFPGGSGLKNPPANEGATRDEGSVPGTRKSPEEAMAAHSSILAGIIPWTEGHDWPRTHV